MSLTNGVRLGSYEIIALIGAGGMGEVYRARDTKLKRDVAIKVLPPTFSDDADRRSRFQREAELLATLNHSNIAAVYGLEDVEPSAGSGRAACALVMELVEGETLAEHLAGGRLPLGDAIPIARQIIDALEAAHDKGIVHRDLKPANIKIAPDGTVKVLDFGLAKMAEQQGSSPSLSMSPTLSIQATYAGVILGTAAYMSPEQARGKPVDRRTDVWAFGCVLFEMLTGKQVFESAGDTVSDAVAAVLMKEPDWTALPADTPPHIERLLRRCLEKDLKKRLPHIAIARYEIDEPQALPVSAAPASPPHIAERPVWKRVLPVLVGVTLASLGTSAFWWTRRPLSVAQEVTRFPFTLPEDQRFTNVGRQLLTISPNGTRIVYVANQRLYSRQMTEHEARPIAGAEAGIGGITSPTFSPDGQSLVFYSQADQQLKRIAVSGGVAVRICEATNPFGVSWGVDGIIFGQSGGIMRVSANGGKPELLVGVKEGEVAHGPQLLPSGQTILFTLASGGGGDRWDKAKIVVQSLRTGERKTLIEGGSDARYLPTGHIVYARSGVLFAVPFDAERLQVTPGPVPVIEGVRRAVATATGTAQFSVANTGSLIYIPGPATTTANEQALALVDRKGVAEQLKVRPAAYEFPRVSPNGSRIAVGTDDGKDANVWIYDLSASTAIRQLTFAGRNKVPVWTTDGKRVAFQSDREGDLAIFWQLADGTGTAERLTKPDKDTAHVPESFSADGKILSFDVERGSRHSLWTLALEDKKTAAFSDVQSSNFLTSSSFSPDGRWLAYESSAADGAASVFVQPFPPTGAKYLAAANAIHPIWSPDGRELFFNSRGQFSVVSVVTKPSFAVGNTTALRSAGAARERGPGFSRDSDVLPDGNRVIGIVAPDITQSASANVINVVLNWFTELQQRVPTR
jgi:serine/threonine protein kinase/Tol biopolymer transport system component